MSRSTSWLLPVVLLIAVLGTPACAAIEGIFKAGVWSGVIMVIVALVVVGGIAAALRR
jgi:hypothetical protein